MFQTVMQTESYNTESVYSTVLYCTVLYCTVLYYQLNKMTDILQEQVKFSKL